MPGFGVQVPPEVLCPALFGLGSTWAVVPARSRAPREGSFLCRFGRGGENHWGLGSLSTSLLREPQTESSPTQNLVLNHNVPQSSFQASSPTSHSGFTPAASQASTLLPPRAGEGLGVQPRPSLRKGHGLVLLIPNWQGPARATASATECPPADGGN